MKTGTVVLILATTALAGAGGYWLGQHGEAALSGFVLPGLPWATATPGGHEGHGNASGPRPETGGTTAANGRPRKVLYYRNPMGLPDTSPVPIKDEMGMDYLPVYEAEAAPVAHEGHGGAAPPAPAGGTAGNQPRKILYYRNPMGLPDVSPAPKKDGMGMDYVPVYEDEAAAGGTVKVSADRVQMLGVRTEPAALRRLERDVRALGTLDSIERNLQVVSTKFPGWVEALHADTTGLPVKAGTVLMELYSPELVTAQQDYLTAIKSGTPGLGEAALRRLRNWDISEDQLQRLRREGTVARTLSVRSPISGVITLKDVFQGQMIEPGRHLYHIVDLSRLWVLAEVFEQDIGFIREGQGAAVTVPAFPGRVLEGKVAFVHPGANPDTRTTQVHIEIDNPDGLLRPALSAAVELRVPLGSGPVVSVPDSAVLDSGSRQVVLVERREGQFEPRPVRLGARTGGFVEIRSGLADGERVVVRANFLIDAESNLKAALSGFAPQAGPVTAEGATPGGAAPAGVAPAAAGGQPASAPSGQPASAGGHAGHGSAKP